VEYCYHCASHLTLKHDPGKYESVATQLMQALEMAARGNAWVRDQEAKVTGLRVPINPKNYSRGVVHGARCIDANSVEAASSFIPPASKEALCQPAKEGCRYNEYEQRTGALEIQVACEHPRFGLVVATLHSKLAVRMWPNPILAAKRLGRFLDVCATSDIDDVSTATETATGPVVDAAMSVVITPASATASESVEVATATEAPVVLTAPASASESVETETLVALGPNNVATVPTATVTTTVPIAAAAMKMEPESEPEPEPAPMVKDKGQDVQVDEGGGAVAELQEADTVTDGTEVEAAETKEEDVRHVEAKAGGATTAEADAKADAGTTTAAMAAAEPEKTEDGDDKPSAEV
jgi:hypothetical protein